jgi:replicative DNA helicase
MLEDSARTSDGPPRSGMVAAELVRMGKMTNPVTIKTFLPADKKVGDMTVAHYLARLAAEAVNVINAADHGRAIYDLATRRGLITVGQDMVNITAVCELLHRPPTLP